MDMIFPALPGAVRVAAAIGIRRIAEELRLWAVDGRPHSPADLPHRRFDQPTTGRSCNPGDPL